MAQNPNLLSGLIRGPGLGGEIIGGFNPDGTKTTKPITFLGGTVLGFNATLGIGPLEESSLDVEIINDCFANSFITDPQGDYFLGEINIGAPVFFDLGEATALEPNRQAHEDAVANKTKEVFRFGGILQSFTAQQSSGGLTFNARVVDPRSLLSGVTIVVGNNLTGPIKHRNYYNAYAYYEYNVLKPSKKNPEDNLARTLPNTVEQDIIVDLEGRSDISDCSVFGSANSDERGMLYHRVIEAINAMNPLVYSVNYGEEFSPALDGRDKTVAQARRNTKHEQNVFKIDLSSLPDPPLYYRVPGPNITLLDLISNVCEATGHLFHVTLEENPNPNGLHTIKIKVEDILNIRRQNDFKSEILTYNGKATDLSYGKELSTENTRTLMIGEQKHEMYESLNIEPFFGEDKYQNPIVPVTGSDERCGWEIEIYLDDLNHSLRCPLYDYDIIGQLPELDGEGNPVLDEQGNPVYQEDDEGNPVFGVTEERKNNIVQRKVRLTEFHIRVAMSSLDLWEKYVFNPFNNEDMSQIIRRNFPDLTNTALTELYKSMTVSQEAIESGLKRPIVVENAAGNAIGDMMANFNSKLLTSLTAKQAEAKEHVYNYFSQLARTYYGKQYLASISKDLCVADAGYVDLTYINAAGIKVDKEFTVINDPCSDNEDKKTVLKNKLWQPKIYTHIPTNEGAWIENCGSVLGLGGKEDPDEEPYLDFFRTEDGRVQPMARFDSKVLSLLYRTEALIEDGMSYDVDDPNLATQVVASWVDGLFKSGEYTEIDNLDPRNILFASGICGDLDIRDWSLDNYIQVRVTGNCPPPVSGADPVDAIDLPATVWARCTVGEKFYIDPSGCLTYKDYQIVPIQLDPSDPCCGKYQEWNPLADCYWDRIISGPPPDKDCIIRELQVIEKLSCSGVVKIPIVFNEPCCTKYCDDQNQLEMLATEMEQVLAGTSDFLEDGQVRISYTYDEEGLKKDGKIIPTTRRFCYTPNPSGISIIASALDFNSGVNQKLAPTAFIPTAVAIPVKSNIEAYGPWKSKNFETSSGGIELIQDPDLCPWIFNSVALMNTFAEDIINDRAFNKSEIETGSITVPTFPDKPLGFIKNGPNLTNINVNMGSNGVTTTYSYRTYTPKFGGIKKLEKEALRKNLELVNKIRRLSREKERKIDTLNRKIKGAGIPIKPELNPRLRDGGTLHRIIVGETYPFGLITDPNYVTLLNEETNEEEVVQSGYVVRSSGDRTVVGTETLQKSVLELRYNYRKKAFMSWDGLLSPVTNSGVESGVLPMYAYYSGFPSGAHSIYNSPNPPVQYSGNDVHNISIDRSYLDPLTNPFGSGDHHHIGSGAGHNIDIVGRGSGAPESGVIMNFYGQDQWDERYSDEYRFLGLRGPLVLHAWGYDTQGKPIPNAIDDEDLIHKSGIFRTEVSGEGDVAVTGLQDYFMQDWLHKPRTWPVAPVDLRYDRQRGVWVSPPDYKIVVVEAGSSISAYDSGVGYLINERENKKYNQEIYDASGVPVKADEGNEIAKITIEDRIGRNISPGEKSYAYFDSFTSTYLLMGGGGGAIKIGKFCNQWPSLSNVKDPANAVKKVVLYEPAKSGCDGYGTDLESCPWALEPVMIKISGVDVPLVVEAINLFANVAAHEYQTKWCALSQDGDTYYLLAAEC